MAHVEADRCISVAFGGSGPYKNRFATMDADGTAHVANATDVVLGVFLFEQKSVEDRAATVCFSGVTKVKVGSGGPVVAGNRLGSDASGEAEDATGDIPHAVAIAMEGGAVGDVISTMLKHIND